jgi:hypothetical protein
VKVVPLQHSDHGSVVEGPLLHGRHGPVQEVPLHPDHGPVKAVPLPHGCHGPVNEGRQLHPDDGAQHEYVPRQPDAVDCTVRSSPASAAEGETRLRHACASRNTYTARGVRCGGPGMLMLTVLYILCGCASVHSWVNNPGLVSPGRQRKLSVTLRSRFRYPVTVSSTSVTASVSFDGVHDQERLVAVVLSGMHGLGSALKPSTRPLPGFFVTERIPYEPDIREKSMERVVHHLRVRQQERATAGFLATDKACNPLIAVAGSSGVGKSTFLAHLAESKAYVRYCGASSIVAPITFNTGMGSGPVAVGLRILFGAGKAMGYFNDASLTWPTFQRLTKTARYLTAKSAVEVLKKLYGSGRRVLILVDELAKACEVVENGGSVAADADARVMSQLGVVLDNCGDVDIVVSALSPPYISALVMKSSRRVVLYEPMEPLYNLVSGSEACERWAANMLQDKIVDAHVERVFQRATRLASGHARSLEFMLTAFKTPGSGLYPAGVPSDSFVDFSRALRWLVGAVMEVCGTQLPPAQCIEEFVLRVEPVTIAAQEVVRKHIEEGSIFLQRRAGDASSGRCYLASPLSSLLSLILSPDKVLSEYQDLQSRPRLATFKRLLWGAGSLSELWERSIDASILVRSVSTSSALPSRSGGQVADLGEVFAVPGLQGLYIPMAVGPAANPAPGVHYLNKHLVLTVPPEQQRGYDSKYTAACADGRTLLIATQAKVDNSSKISPATYASKMSKIYARTVVNTVVELAPELERTQKLRDLHVVFYNHAAPDAHLDWGAIAIAASTYLDNQVRRASEVSEQSAGCSTASSYNELGAANAKSNFGDAAVVSKARAFFALHLKTNVHLVPHSDLVKWLIPSLVNLPSLAAGAFEEVE